jgi:hypothetical protein
MDQNSFAQCKPLSPTLTSLCQALVASYYRWTQCELIPGLNNNVYHLDPCIVTEQLYEHNAVVLAHNTAADPTFVFANRIAMQLWEYSWSEIIGLPSRLTAEPDLRPIREQLLDRVRQFGFIDDYSGVRVSKTGQRFRIEQATVWNILAPSGEPIGQAATFSHWTHLTENQP